VLCSKDFDVTVVTRVDLFERTPLEVFDVALNLKGREVQEVDEVGLCILEVIETILHTDEVIEGPHRPEVVLAGAPAGMEDARITRISRTDFLTDYLVTVHDLDDVVLKEGVGLPVV